MISGSIIRFFSGAGYVGIYIAGLRIISEQFRLPDEHIGYVVKNFSMGSMLSFIMIILGILFSVGVVKIVMWKLYNKLSVENVDKKQR